MTIQDRQRGTLLGLAVGDALGAAVEFQPPGTFELVTGYRAGGPHGLNAGEWTDDSSMALALADSIAEIGWDLNDQARRYVAWWRDGKYSVNGRCFDIGMTVRSALSRFQQTGDATTSGSTASQASGNGSIMRLAPVPIRYTDLFPTQIDELITFCIDSSRPTHGSEQCLSACAYFGLVLTALINGVDRDEVLAPDWELLSRLKQLHPMHPEIAEVAGGSFRRKQPPEIVGRGKPAAKVPAVVEKYDPDILVLQEIARPADESEYCSYAWYGSNKNQGNMVIGFNGWIVEEIDLAPDAELYQAVRLSKDGDLGFNLVNLHVKPYEEAPKGWTGWRQYLYSFDKAVECFDGLLGSEVTALIGDFNILNYQLHLEITDQYELFSAYHTFTDEFFGHETRATLYHMKKKDKRFHFDACYLPTSWESGLKRAKVGGMKAFLELSDHMPIFVELNDKVL